MTESYNHIESPDAAMRAACKEGDRKYAAALIPTLLDEVRNRIDVLRPLLEKHGQSAASELLVRSQADLELETLLNLGPRSEPVTLKFIAEKVCQKHGDVSVSMLKSRMRKRSLNAARHEFCWLARRLTYKSLPEIGQYMGGRDHTSILHSVRQHQKRIDAQRQEATNENPS